MINLQSPVQASTRMFQAPVLVTGIENANAYIDRQLTIQSFGVR